MRCGDERGLEVAVALPSLTQQQVDNKQQRSQACDQQVAYLLQRVSVTPLFVEDVVVHLQHVTLDVI